MPAPNVLLTGYTASMYMQTGATPVPLTTANLSVVASVSPIAVAGNLIPLEEIPEFGGFASSVKTFAQAGFREMDQVPVQATPETYSIIIPWNPSNTIITTLRADAYSGLIDRTYVLAATADNTNYEYFAFNGRVSAFQINSNTGNEAQALVTIARRGNQYGWSNTA